MEHGRRDRARGRLRLLRAAVCLTIDPLFLPPVGNRRSSLAALERIEHHRTQPDDVAVVARHQGQVVR